MKRLSLGKVFVVAIFAIGIIVCGAFAIFVRSSHESIRRDAGKQQDVVAKRAQGRVVRELDRARRVLDDVDRGVHAGAIAIESPDTLEPDLFTELLDDEHVAEVAFTRATLTGDTATGEAILAPDPRWQLSVYRAKSGGIHTRVTRQAADHFSASVLTRDPNASFGSTTLTGVARAEDPTREATFEVIAAKGRRGVPIWSDLHWSEIDAGLPEAERRVVVSVQKTVADPAGRFVGVLRVGLLTSELDAILGAETDADRVALLATTTDGKGVHLVARVDPSDRLADLDGDLRVVSSHPPPEIAALFASPLVTTLDPDHPNADGTLDVAGTPWLATLREVALGRGGTQGWSVAVLVPESRYTTDLLRFERHFIVSFASTLALVLLIGAMTLTMVRRGLGRITVATSRMRAFDFEPSRDASALREIDDVMTGLERAKTVVRAMERYVPIDLVRRLYSTNREPVLGGELQDLSIMFTDIEGFTSLSEKLPADVLAQRLGAYLEAMTSAIEKTNGTIDKYIGDAVMAIWNAPSPVPGHARRACRAALDCMVAARELYASPKWGGLPALVTRFGLHEARVMVGNFGSPTRFSYTALGDGVNLAARLEPLCKQYGVAVLASESIMQAAKSEFVFRHVDRVAVKGKTEWVDVYELLGAIGDEIPNVDVARRYEKAFDAYLDRDFEGAIAILDPQCSIDPASNVLAARCRELAADAPPPEWNGVHVAMSK